MAASRGAQRCTNQVANMPLPTSIKATPNANFQPCVRSALVPPALPLPKARISTPRIRPSTRLPDTDPSR